MLMVLTLLHSIMLIEGKKRILVVEEGRIGKKCLCKSLFCYERKDFKREHD